jgi:putative membrane protein
VTARYLSLLPGLIATGAHGHGGEVHGPEQIWRQWDLDPVVLIPLLLVTGWYSWGLWCLWRRAGTGRGISRLQASAYFSGTLVLVIALLSPLDTASAALFSVHMVQHLLLILVAPPLLVVGAADVAFLWGLPPGWRKRFGRFEHGVGRALTGESGATAPLIPVLLATGVLWLWHLPALYDLAVEVEAIHMTEHAGFLISALLFWITVLRLRPRDHVRNGMRLLYVFGMALQGSLLGALITFAARPLYRSHLESAQIWGMQPLADQQLAGLIMWVPPALLYIGVAAYLFVHWLNAVETRRQGMDARIGKRETRNGRREMADVVVDHASAAVNRER